MILIRKLALFIMLCPTILMGQSDSLDVQKRLTTQSEVSNTFILNSKDFSKGRIYDLHDAVRGQIPGMLFSKDGSNPNGNYELRYRGLKTINGNPEPINYFNGVRYSFIDLIEPLDIKSVSWESQASKTVSSGLGSANGVLFVETQEDTIGGFTFHQDFSFSFNTRKYNTLNTSEYVSLKGPGFDQGSSTDWWKEVIRTAFSTASFLSYNNVWKNTQYGLAGSFRNTQGVGNNTGFKQYYSRLRIDQNIIPDKLKLVLHANLSSRKGEPGFNETYKYATIYNPTAAILDPNSQFGGYSQSFLFDYSNPVAIIEQGIHERRQSHLLGTFHLTSENLIENLGFSLRGSFQKQDEIRGEYFPADSYFRGSQNQLNLFGYSNDLTHRAFDATIEYEKIFKSLKIKPRISYQYDFFNRESNRLNRRDLNFEPFKLDNIEQELDETRELSDWTLEEHTLLGMIASLGIEWEDKLSFNMSYSRNGSSRFSELNKWSSNIGLDLESDLFRLFKMNSDASLILRLGYFEMTNDAYAPHLYLRGYIQADSTYFEGISEIYASRNENPDLKGERTSEFSSHIEFNNKQRTVRSFITWYSNSSDDFISPVQVSSPPNFTNRTYVNLKDVLFKNSGVDLGTEVLYKLGKVKAKSRIQISFYNSSVVLKDVSLVDSEMTLLSSGGTYYPDLSSMFVTLIPGESPAQFWGLSYQGIADGQAVFDDINNNGFVPDLDDYIPLGSGLPNASLSLSQTMDFGKLEITTIIRGDFGHNIANSSRRRYEYLNQFNDYNIIQTPLYESFGFQQPFSSHYVESGSYLVVDNISFRYSLASQNLKAFSALTLGVDFNNILYLSGFSGPDPQVRLSDSGFGLNGSRNGFEFNPLVLSAGIDRINRYPLESSLTISLSAKF